MVDNYISIDLNDSRAKNISEIIGNKTCKKILNLLAEKELNESEIADELNIPLNSVDYNIKKLIKSGLIESSKHKWSVRGKRMPSYKISDKKIIISPKRISSNVLLIPALLVGGAIAFVVKKLTQVPSINFDFAQTKEAAGSLMMASPRVTSEVADKIGFFPSIAGWEWFLIGIWSGIILFFLMSYIKYKNERR
jgi:DNA-binding transcriptional ArsR family regulator